MTVGKKVKSYPHIVDYFKKLPVYNKHIEKPGVKRFKKFLKRVKNIDLLSELPFYEELSLPKTDYAFRGYEMSYNVKLVEKKDPIKQLESIKSSIKDLLSDLLNETKGVKY